MPDLDEWTEGQDPPRRNGAGPAPESLESRVREMFLEDFDQFDEPWLNRLQQRFDDPWDFQGLFQTAPTQTRTVTRFKRAGLEGRVVGYEEVTVPASSANAKNSTSLLRKPANHAEFVRGAAGFFPFAPGGLEGIEAIARIEDQAFLEAEGKKESSGLDRVFKLGREGGLLEIPPGFSRGMVINEEKHKVNEAAQEVENDLGTMDNLDDVLLGHDNGSQQDEIQEGSITDSSDEGDDDIDALLPNEFSAFEPAGKLALSSKKHTAKEWAHVVDVNKEITNFRELVPEMAKEYSFELDTFQKEAVYHLENGDSVFVAAHTSAGKTVVAEYAIALAAKHMTKAIYTSPIKALSNQKYRDFKNIFDEVGILTGDVQISPESSCLIMTTEILRSMLYRGADIIRDVEFVIFDEVHYVNDQERGVVWEEVIIMLPEHVTLILLSATVPNTYEFASWVGRTKKKDIYVISTPKRPVPLEHYLWAEKDMYKIVDSEKRFLEGGWKKANDKLSGRDKIAAQKEAQAQAQSQAARGAPAGRGGRGGQQRGGAIQRGGQRGGGQQRGRGAPASRGVGNIARTGRGGGRTTAAQDRTVWVELVQRMKKDSLLPACIFVFSKKRCEENASNLSNQDFCDANEKSNIHMIIERSLARLKPEDRNLPQIRRVRDLLSRGIAVHHGGLLPIVKEIVEILFARTLVKVLFATETFAMGLNLPTRTVVFSGIRKHDGRSFRDLLPGEYTQMAGRAGRRGLDTVGNVIIVSQGKDEAPPAGVLKHMMLGPPTKLRSQFRLTYNMILNLLRVEALKIEEMIKRSFSENATQALLPEHQKQVELSTADLAKLRREPCKICDEDLENFHAMTVKYQDLSEGLHLKLLSSAVGKRYFAAKQVVVYKMNGIRKIGIILKDGVASGPPPTCEIFEIGPRHAQPTDPIPFISGFSELFPAIPLDRSELTLRQVQVPVSAIECVTQTAITFQKPIWFLNIEKEAVAFVRSGMPYLQNMDDAHWQEQDYFRVKDMNTYELVQERNRLRIKMQLSKCTKCPEFVKHYTQQHAIWNIQEEISQLKQLMSDQNLQLLPDYQQRLQVLQDLGFVDADNRIQLKGKVACEIHSADELVLTELIFENVLSSYTPEEIVALLSAFIFKEKSDIKPNLTSNLERGWTAIAAISKTVNTLQVNHQVIMSPEDADDFESRPRWGMVEVVYEWARGMSFDRITDLTDVMEGTIVRTINRLDETCREVKSAAKLVGDPVLFQKMEKAQELIKRDVCFAASLYM